MSRRTCSRRMPPNGTATRVSRRRPWLSSASSASWACWCPRPMAGRRDHVGYAWRSKRSPRRGATSTILSVNRSAAPRSAIRFGGAEAALPRALRQRRQARRFCLTEPQAGSDAAAIKTRRASRQPVDRNRHETVHHLGQNARCRDPLAVTDPAPGRKGISAFIVRPRAGYRRPVEHKLGQRASDTAQLSLRTWS